MRCEVVLPGYSGSLFLVASKESQSLPSPRTSLFSSGGARGETPGC